MIASHETHPAQQPQSRALFHFKQFFGHLVSMPRWQRIFIGLAFVAGVMGWAGGLARSAQPSPGSQLPSSSPRSSAFDSTDTSSVPTASQPPSRGLTPWYGRVGVSLVIGFVIGWLSRTFAKIAATVAIAFAGVLGTLSYFHVMNVDMTNAANETFHTASAWVSSEAGHLKDIVSSHAPSTAGCFFGAFMGMRRHV